MKAFLLGILVSIAALCGTLFVLAQDNPTGLMLLDLKPTTPLNMRIQKIENSTGIYVFNDNFVQTYPLTPQTVFLADLAANLPLPDWWDDIIPPDPVPSDARELLNIWGSKKRCCVSEEVLTQNNREFYKNAWLAILAHPEDETLVGKALRLMGALQHAHDKEYYYTTYEILLENFPEHDKPTTGWCLHCKPANTIARSALDLANRYQHDKKGWSIGILQHTLSSRKDEISPWVQAGMLSTLAKLHEGEEFYLVRPYIDRFWAEYGDDESLTYGVGERELNRMMTIYRNQTGTIPGNKTENADE